MSTSQPKRITRELTPEERDRLKHQRELIAQELPDLTQRDQMRKDAQDEQTLSGELRRAIHTGNLSLKEIAAQTGIAPNLLDEFLTGERTLRSDVMDRLASVLGFKFQPAA
jgi:hypothetical protein